jgi:hypothetical protein
MQTHYVLYGCLVGRRGRGSTENGAQAFLQQWNPRLKMATDQIVSEKRK